MVNFRNEKTSSNNSITVYMVWSLGKKMLVAFAIQDAICPLGNNFLPVSSVNRIQLLLEKKFNL